MTTRTDRIAAALAHVATLNLSQDEAAWAGEVLRGATRAILRGKPAAAATTLRIIDTPEWQHQDAYQGERAALDTLEILCGSEAAFEALSPERKATVIRYALAVVTQGTDPGSGWGPLSVAVGAVAWHEVAAVARGTRKAA